ncbi:anthranilate synthase component I [Bacillus sp. FJAT-49705]|uniref:Anthranilate synthase component 1 n=1 Tax=Cytobacillus citreus TaxID=2833586 RepID=A0ABS5P0Q0_9BACI|nr:anthranilate synthase component I [Cytobacillus citreus]MBS4193023.1 anthranilate synthase component I [Cytobacillus citreus]
MKTKEQILIKELEGDTLTPILIFQRLSGKKKFLLESSLKHERSGRFSFIGADPTFELIGEGNSSFVISGDEKELIHEKPLEVLKKLLPEDHLQALDQFPFCGGAVGFIGYDAIRQYEKIGVLLKDELKIPDMHLMFFEEAVVYDHLEQKVYLVAFPLKRKRIELEKQLEKRSAEILNDFSKSNSEIAAVSAFQASMSKENFIKKVKKAKEHILEGDIFQVVLSQRLQATLEGDPFEFYRKLRVKNPSPYMYYLDFEDYKIAGASPESLIKVTSNKVAINPIAGTRQRGKSETEDSNLEKELLEDEKELAEHRMLLDLGRNDIGRVCEFGSIQIEKEMQIEKYKHVMHLVSEVSGKLKKPLSAIDALIACLPAGTVSGAPKIRAMEIINELEDVKRGVYSGAIGYFSANGNMDFALAIRTMVVKDQKAFIQAGAGIVHDSIPEKEYEETIHKLKSFLEDQDDITY